MNALVYQGAALTGGRPGEAVELHAISWRVSEQGHLSADVADDDAAVIDLISRGVVSVQEC